MLLEQDQDPVMAATTPTATTTTIRRVSVLRVILTASEPAAWMLVVAELHDCCAAVTEGEDGH
jgi:hypothetical protein